MTSKPKIKHRLFDEQEHFTTGGAGFDFNSIEPGGNSDWHIKYAEKRKAEETHKADLIQELIDLRLAHVTTNFSICTVCKGTGIYYREELTNYHRGEYDYFEETCHHCGGVGTFKNKEITLKVSVQYPFVLGRKVVE